uniref:Uncharacterized protein n=1 Tax=Zooxanthella nutricula TaxID=1333877 RepID=A0A7S2JZ51_9DINO
MLRLALAFGVTIVCFRRLIKNNGVSLDVPFPVSVGALLLLYFVVLVEWVWPCLLSEWSLNYWYVCLSVILVATNVVLGAAQLFCLQGRVSIVSSLIVALSCDTPWLIWLSNLALLVCRLIMHPKVFSDMMAPPILVFVGESITFLLTVGLAHHFHSSSFMQIHKDVTERALRQESGAMTRLLDLTCDLVLEMDSDLRISHQSPKLALMLTLGSSWPALNAQLQDFMPLDSDKVRFQTLARGFLDDEAEALPSAMHATMRGPHNASLQIELFFAVFPGMDGKKRLLVGVREVPDSPVLGLPGQDAVTFSPSWDERAPSDSSSSSQEEEPPCGSFDNAVRRSRRSAAAAVIAASAIVPSDSGSSQVSGHRRNRRRGKRRGTPPSSRRRSLDAAGGEPKEGPKDVLLDSRFLETRSSGKEWSLLQTMAFWNITVRRGSCCAFHSYIDELASCCFSLSMRGCFDSAPTGDAQCQECGMLAEWMEEPGAVGDGSAVQHCDVCTACAVRRLMAPAQAPTIQSL